MSELVGLSKGELMNKCRGLLATCSHQTIVITEKNKQIRNMRLRLRKIRNQIDYLLEFPYSTDTGFHTKKHSRDNPHTDLKRERGAI